MKVLELFGGKVKIRVNRNGDVYSLKHNLIRKNGRIDNRNGRKLKQHTDKYGYKRVTVTYDGKRKDLLVHRLVGICYIPNNENKPTINHINGIKTDNRVENLEWATAKEQKEHAIRTGLCNQNIEGLKKANNEKAIKVEIYGKVYNSIRGASRELQKSEWYINRYGKRVVVNE